MALEFCLCCVDFQYDFAEKGGINFNKGSSVNFIKNTLFPWLKSNNLKSAEIVSDYRLPRGKSNNESCVPGTKGFESLLPNELRNGQQWCKCMHNPLWVRENIGVPNAKIGDIFQDPVGFSHWVSAHLPQKNIVLFGLTADCCILHVAAELYFRGHDVYCIYEATDPMNERLSHKDFILKHSSLSIYSKILHFDELDELMGEKQC